MGFAGNVKRVYVPLAKDVAGLFALVFLLAIEVRNTAERLEALAALAVQKMGSPHHSLKRLAVE